MEKEIIKLIEYFHVALTVPEKYLWVNLSPYEENRVVSEELGMTQMGIDLLAQDYILKQLTASLIYPESELGKKFWQRIWDDAIEPKQVAEIVFKAIKDEQFYILTHPEYNDGIRVRFEDIIQGRNPTNGYKVLGM